MSKIDISLRSSFMKEADGIVDMIKAEREARPRPSIHVSYFVSHWLPFFRLPNFTWEDKETGEKVTDIPQRWAENVSNGFLNEVDVIGDDGSVIAVVPPLEISNNIIGVGLSNEFFATFNHAISVYNNDRKATHELKTIATATINKSLDGRDNALAELAKRWSDLIKFFDGDIEEEGNSNDEQQESFDMFDGEGEII